MAQSHYNVVQSKISHNIRNIKPYTFDTNIEYIDPETNDS